MELQETRNKIDEIDSEIAKLLCKRLNLCNKIAKYKLEQKLPVLDVEREKQKMHKLSETVDIEFVPYVNEIFKDIMNVSKTYQKDMMFNDFDSDPNLKDR